MSLNSFFQLSIWNTAFRPFFLFGAIQSFAVLSIWILILLRLIPNPIVMNPIHWHSYEMVFGFSRAIIIGFLFTAAQNWTGKTITRGKSLFILSLLWLLGRFIFLDNIYIQFLSAGFDLSFDFFALSLLTKPLYAEGQRHNRIIVYNFIIFTILHILTLFSFSGLLDSQLVMHFIHISIFSILVFIVIIAGRILPFFTGIVVPNYNFKKNETVENIVIQTSFLFIALELSLAWTEELRIAAGLFAIFFAIANLLRLLTWKSWLATRYPILIILHIGYVWLVIGLFLYGLSHLNLFPYSSSLHILTIGCIGIFIYGMITRVSLGHTGRKIQASNWIVLSYILINLAVIVRSFFPIANFYLLGYSISGILWIVAFGIFILTYFKILIQPRPDGKLS
ncbi:NnrS family protein [Leptospira sp. GIMC2001]|uniref:NnrS family protein n=1 Tax=Leptospira sp. GIMC2001 TaxID=1513297 RepID=UPI00234A5547|nr:NnrS family protein [Leptospira sp. GIMC2001]WCL49874.1 NnrS family protein [Leptospira sp. GIMC2001]